MIKNDFNGWTNRQTWNINLTYQETFTVMCEEQEYDDVEHMADSFTSIVYELEFYPIREGTLARYAVGEYLDQVNWLEIAEHYAADFDLFKEKEEDSEEDIKGLRELLVEAELE